MVYVDVVKRSSMTKQLSSLQNQQVKEWCLLHQAKYRKQYKLFIVEGFHLVDLAYQANVVECLLVLTYNERYPAVEQIIVNQGIIDKVSVNNSANAIVAICRIIEQTFDFNQDRYLILDQVQDPGNVGTIIRTARAFGVHHIILSDDCADLYNSKVVKATQGACFTIKTYRGPLDIAIEQLKFNHVPILISDLKADVSLNDLPFFKRFALVVGNEGQGISDKVKQSGDYFFKIPMDDFDSLNVAVAAGISLYKLNR
jgi:RNA methyltransferase, TrmH family